MRKGFLILIPLVICVAVLAGFIFIYNLGITKENEHSTVAVIKQEETKPRSQINVVTTPKPEASKELKRDESLKIVAVGDILLGRGVGSRLKEQKKDFTYPFKQVADLLRKGDVIFGNLEEPITDKTHSLTGIKEGGKWVLKNDVAAFEGIKYAGFNLLNLANNHILDYYEDGLFDTLDILDKSGIVYTGAGKNIDQARKLAVIEKKGVKVGMLSYTDMSEVLYKGNPPLRFKAENNKAGVSPLEYDFSIKPAKYDYKAMEQDIKKVRSSVDILIVSLHWGQEESFDVLPEQINFAHHIIDSGADIILGHHPHQFQGIEIYKGKPIVYSMGNFIFDQNDPENQESFILEFEYNNKKLSDFSAIPVRTIQKTQVVPQTGKSAESLLNREMELSKKLSSECTLKNDRIVFGVN
ncbi:MAG: CapA family protein [Clostridia bacterium]|nr:CapA family protein [Clostridia bacterium]